jgi:hypothetical protein
VARIYGVESGIKAKETQRRVQWPRGSVDPETAERLRSVEVLALVRLDDF